MRTCTNHALLPSRPPPRLHAARPAGVPRAGVTVGEGEQPLVRGSATGSQGWGLGPASARPCSATSCPQTRQARERTYGRPGGLGLQEPAKQEHFSKRNSEMCLWAHFTGRANRGCGRGHGRAGAGARCGLHGRLTSDSSSPPQLPPGKAAEPRGSTRSPRHPRFLPHSVGKETEAQLAGRCEQGVVTSKWGFRPAAQGAGARGSPKTEAGGQAELRPAAGRPRCGPPRRCRPQNAPP